MDLVPVAALEEALVSDGVRLASVAGGAGADLRAAYREAPDPGEPLDEPLTLKDMRELHEVVAGETLICDSFRRFMEPKLQGTGQMSDGTRGGPRGCGGGVGNNSCPARRSCRVGPLHKEWSQRRGD